MAYRTVLVEHADDSGLEARLQVARTLASRFGAALTGLHVMPPPLIPGAYGEATADLGPDLIEAQHAANHETSERVRAIFRNLCGEGAVWQEAEGARGAAMLRRHGRAVHPRQVDRPDGDAGEALLAQAGLQRADLLVVGAYGHARLRELVFGGAPPRPAQRRPARVLRQRAPPLASP